jgi:hypothetical protein
MIFHKNIKIRITETESMTKQKLKNNNRPKKYHTFIRNTLLYLKSKSVQILDILSFKSQPQTVNSALCEHGGCRWARWVLESIVGVGAHCGCQGTLWVSGNTVGIGEHSGYGFVGWEHTNWREHLWSGYSFPCHIMSFYKWQNSWGNHSLCNLRTL